MFVLYFCRQKVPNKRWRGAAAEQQQQSRWQRRRSQADNVLPRLPQGPRLRRSVLVWVGSRPGLLGSAVLAVVPASSAVSQLLWTSVPGLTLTPARPQQNRWSVLYSDSWMWEDINIVLRAAWWGPHCTGFSAGPRGSCMEEGGRGGTRTIQQQASCYSAEQLPIFAAVHLQQCSCLFFFHFVVIEVTPLLPTSRVLCGRVTCFRWRPRDTLACSWN